LMNAKKTRKSMITLSIAVTIAVIGSGGLIAYAAGSAVPADFLSDGTSNVTVQYPDDKIDSYDKDGNSAQAEPKASSVPQELTYEEILKRVSLFQENGIPVPEEYLDYLNNYSGSVAAPIEFSGGGRNIY